MDSPVAVSVLVPTIGRVSQLERCLESVSRCDPPPAEIVVVDQSGDAETAKTVARFAGARRIECSDRGIGLAMNLGLREAGHETVLVTHDDCTVERDWVGAAHELMSEQPDGIVTGRVLPRGDPSRVPSTRDDPEPHDYTGELRVGALYPNNMALNRSGVFDLGGFDERFRDAAEDCDLCYRWLRAGRALRYDPGLVVWHHDWRDDDELRRLQARYWHWIGFFYGKHLRRRDFAVVRFLLRSVYVWAYGVVALSLGREPKRSGNPHGFLRAFPSGFLRGWRGYR